MSSAKKYGGTFQDYLHIHEWFDATKGWQPDARHRSIRHHSEGVIQATEVFPPIRLESGRLVPARRIAEQHVMEDLGEIPTAADYLRCMGLEAWMQPHPESDVNTVSHATSSAEKFGGSYELYLPVHQWLDATRGWLPDARHRAIRHHSEGIAQAVEIFKPIEIPGGSPVSVAVIAEQHVAEDLGEVPTAADYLRCMQVELWMQVNTHRRTSVKIDGKWVAPPRLKSAPIDAGIQGK
jgi:hypothetical protein